ncbi:phage tail length tape measure family protein [uncultured Pseudacidovorax sp.]|uniref:phage tail length tape measure family protein n=1 Tax=uncultured Pseudacidovorax sp. TaxID=679313 RepID=UPI0025E84A0A|nr:phage tail length tape measure family protein [uncultured Pseudacidovorax sp.]
MATGGTTEFVVAMRLKALVDEARSNIQAVNADLAKTKQAGKEAADAASLKPTRAGTTGTSAPAAAPAPPAPAPAPAAAPAAAQLTQAEKDQAEAAKKAADALARQQAELDKLTNSLAPAASAASRLAEAQSQLDAALARGQITQQQHTQLMAQAKDRYDDDAVAVRRLSDELQPAAAGTTKLQQAQTQLDAALGKGLITQQRYNELLAQAQQRYSAGYVSAAQTSAALRQLPAQMTDIVVGLQAGQAPLTVLLQQGGQLKDSFGGAVPALRAVAGAVAAWVNPFTVGAAVVGVLALGFAKGREESRAFENAIIMSGNAAGVTSGQLQDMARRIDGVIGTEAAAAEALTAFVANGNVARADLEKFTTVALRMEKEVGQAVSNTVEQFASLADKPLQASLKLNEKYRYLTVAVYEQIRALEEQGQREAAASVAQNALANALDVRAKQVQGNAGLMERAWRAVKSAAAEAWDAMLGVGRAETATQQLDAVGKKIEALRKAQANGGFETTAGGAAVGGGATGAKARDRELQSLLAQQAALQETVRMEGRSAALQAERTAQVERKAKWDAEGDKYASNAEKREKAILAAKKEAAKLVADGSITQAEADQRIKDIQEKLKDPKGSDPSAFRLASADAGVAMAQIKANLEAMQSAIKIGDAVVQQALQDGQVSLADAFQARVSMLRTGAQTEREALTAELREADKALATAKNAAERGPLAQKKVEIEAKIKTVDANLTEEERKLGIWKRDQERQLQGIQATVRVDVAGVTGRFDADAVRQQIAAKFRPQLEAAGGADTEAERQAGRQRVELLMQAEQAQAEFNFRLQEAQRLQAALAVQESEIQRQVQAGTLSQIEAEGQLRALRAGQVPALQAILAQLQAIRATLPPEAAAAIGTMGTQIDELQVKVRTATPQIVSLADSVRVNLIDSVGDAVAKVGSDFKSLPDLVKASLRQVAANILSSQVKRLLTDAFTPSSTSSSAAGAASSAAGSSSGSLWGALGTLFKAAFFSAGGRVRQYSGGGEISGPGTGTSDSIPALVAGRTPIAVSDGEWIQPVRAVHHYGSAFMEAVRTLRFPRPTGFAFGGLVRSQQAIARYASGGQVQAGQAGAPNVQIAFTNNGTAQRAVSQQQHWDGRDLVVAVVLEDIQAGGPISQQLNVPRG